MKTSTRIAITVFSFFLLFGTPFLLRAQLLPPVSTEQEAVFTKETNSTYLKQWAKQDSAQYYEERARAEDFARSNGYPIKGKTNDGRTFELQGFDAVGQLKYYVTTNRGGAATISTDEVWPGGDAGTALTGQGWTLAVWDGGRVRTTHAELSVKVTHIDNASSFDDHATHVTGTCIARGANSNARGMAYNAQARTFDWNNDLSEMASEAAAGLRVSNHSYGLLTGWEYNSEFDVWEWYGYTTYSQSEDYKFGYYDQDSRDIDQIVYNAPFYLPVMAAGNDRNDYHDGIHWVQNASGIWVQSNTSRPPDGGTDGYDCIPNMGNAKNSLTVGAVAELPNGYGSFTDPDDVDMSTFSGWGPTDDGRIKPDLVAKGIDVISSTAEHNNHYSNFNGTSMAAPMVTGSILLINEHVNNLFPGSSLRASAMKALLIHTADECGTAPGPDYSFGWGLMNTQKAVELLSNDNGRNWFRSRDSISNGDTRSYTFQHDGVDGIKVTIAWTDTPGNVCAPPSSSWWVCDNRMLVNDLDLRLINLDNNTEYDPWRLNPASPASAATRGDNNRDNVEQVHIPNLPAGEYAIVIDHKGTLFSGEQIFSIMLSGIGAAPDVFTCNEAILIECGDELNNATSGNAQNVPICGNSSELNGAPGTWYKFIGEGATVTMSTCASGTNFDTQLAVFMGSCSNLICETGNDDIDECNSNSLSSWVQFFAEAGEDYFVYVTGYGEDSGTFTLQIDCEGTACSIPTGLQSTEVGHAHFTVDWNTAPGTDFYQVWTRQLPNGDWQLSNEYENPGIIFGNRVPASDYEVQVRSKCGDNYGDWSSSIFLTTLGVGTPYCFSYGISWNYWIDRFAIKDAGTSLLNWETGTDYGYSDYSAAAPIPELEKGGTYEFCITPDKRSSLPNESLRYHLYFDWTDDQSFGSGDQDYTWCCSTSLDEFCEAIIIPDDIPNGEYRVRVSMVVDDSDNSVSACAAGGQREVEDYTIRIIDNVQAPLANFNASITCGQAPLSISFTDNSTNNPNDWQWDFGNGQQSSQQNPTITYNTPGIYTVSLNVGNTGGNDSEVKTAYITVVAPAVIDTPAGITACLGESLTLTTNTSADTYLWTGPGLNNTTSTTVLVNPSQAGVFTYDLITTTNGCAADPTSINLSFLALPEIHLTASTNTACLGESITLSATGATQYTWSGPGLNNTSGSSVMANPTQAGSYTYQVSGISGNCMANLETITLEFTDALEVSASASVASTCLGQSITLMAEGASNYIWTGPDLNGQTGSSILVSQNQAGTFTYQVVGSSGNCASATAAVSVQFEAPPLVSLSTSSTTSCVGQAIALTGLGAESYTWSGIGLNNTSGNVVEALPTQAGSYTYQVIGNNGECSSNPQTITLQFNSLPEVEISANTTALCEGQSLSLTASGANTYFWDGPGITGNTGANVTITPTAGQHIFQLIGTESGCESEPASIEIDVAPMPILSAELSSNPACLGDTLFLEANGATQYFWNGPDLLSFTGSNVQAIPSQTGEVVYQLTGTVGECQAQPISIPVTVAHSPLSVSVEMGVCAVGNILFEATVINGGTQPNILWYHNGIAVWSGASYNLFGAQNGDLVYCEVTALNPPICTAPLMVQSEPLVIDCLTSTNEISELENLQLFPNPNTGQFMLNLEVRQAFSGHVIILNHLGQQVLSRQIEGYPGKQQEAFVLSNATAGLYHLLITAQKRVQATKFVVMP